MIFSFFFKKKVKQNEEEERIRREEEFLRRLLKVNDLREEVYKALESNIRKRLEKVANSSKKGKDYIDGEQGILGGKR